MIYDLKRSVDLRWLFDLVLHSSLDDLALFCFKRRSCQSARLSLCMVDVASGYMRTRKYKDNCSSWSHITSRGVNILDRSMNALRNWRKFCRYMFVYVRQLGWFYWNWSNVLVSCGLIQVYSYTSSLKTVHIHCCRKENLDLCLYRVRYPGQLPCGSYSRILRSAQALCFDWLLLSGTASTPLGIYD